MRTKLVTVALAGTLGLAGGALLVPGAALAQTADGGTAVTDRVTAIRDALKGLVSDGTLDQAQADKVASTLAETLPHRGHGGRGHGARLDPAVVAEAAGATVEELRAAHEAGRTLAQLAQENGVSKEQLVQRLVDKAEERLAAEVTAGRLTQAQADEKQAGLTERITAMVDRVGHGPGHRGRGHGPGHGSDAPPAAPQTEGSSLDS